MKKKQNLDFQSLASKDLPNPISGRFPLGLIFSNGLKPPTRDTFSLMQKNIGKKLRQKFPRYRKFIQKAASDHTETTGKKISEKKSDFGNEDLVETLSLYVFFQMCFLNSDSYWPFLSKCVGPKGDRVKHQRKTQQRSTWWFQIFFIFIPTWGNDPICLIFFEGVETTN